MLGATFSDPLGEGRCAGQVDSGHRVMEADENLPGRDHLAAYFDAALAAGGAQKSESWLAWEFVSR